MWSDVAIDVETSGDLAVRKSDGAGLKFRAGVAPGVKAKLSVGVLTSDGTGAEEGEELGLCGVCATAGDVEGSLGRSAVPEELSPARHFGRILRGHPNDVVKTGGAGLLADISPAAEVARLHALQIRRALDRQLFSPANFFLHPQTREAVLEYRFPLR